MSEQTNESEEMNGKKTKGRSKRKKNTKDDVDSSCPKTSTSTGVKSIIETKPKKSNKEEPNGETSKKQVNKLEQKNVPNDKSQRKTIMSSSGKPFKRVTHSVLQQKIKQRRNPLTWRLERKLEKLDCNTLQMKVEALEQLTVLRENQLNMLTEFKRTIGSELNEIRESLDNQIHYLQSITSCLETFANRAEEHFARTMANP